MEFILIFIEVASIIVSGYFLYVCKHNPEFFCRPSVLILLFVHVRIQWPSVFMWSELSRNTDNVTTMYFLIHGFMLISLWAISITGFRYDFFKSRTVHRALLQPLEWHYNFLKPSFKVMLFSSIVITMIYFALVPFNETGLYHLLTNPLGLSHAREESLKLLNVAWIKYLFSLQINTFAPFLLIISFVIFKADTRPANRFIALIALLWASLNMLMTGSRSGFVFIPLILMILQFIFKKWKISYRILLLGLAAIILIPTYVTVVREGRTADLDTMIEYADIVAFGRIFKTPLRTGSYYVDYAERRGFVGVSAIRPLAAITGNEYVFLARDIGQSYVSENSETILANTSFLFSYYVAFGLMAIPLSVIFLLLFDLLLIPVANHAISSLPLVVLFFLKAGSLSEGVFTTSFLTGGYFLIPFLAYLIHHMSKRESIPRGIYQ